MEPKVLLYNADNEKIGETYARRARQLVRQQRAHWLDESETAVKFLPGMEHVKDMETDERPASEMTASEKKLMKLAKSRVLCARIMKMLYSMYLAVNAFLIGIWLLTGGGYFWPIWVLGGWGTGLVVLHIILKTWMAPPVDMNARIEREYRALKKLTGMEE